MDTMVTGQWKTEESMLSAAVTLTTISYSQSRLYNHVYHDNVIMKIMLQILLNYNMNSIEFVLHYNTITSLNQLSLRIVENVDLVLV